MMPKEVGRIVVATEHRSDKLDRGLKDAERKVKASASRMDKVTTTGPSVVDKASAGLGKVAAGAALIEVGGRAASAAFKGLDFFINRATDSIEESERKLNDFTDALQQIPVIGSAIAAGMDLAQYVIGDGGAAKAAAEAGKKEVALKDQKLKLVQRIAREEKLINLNQFDQARFLAAEKTRADQEQLRKAGGTQAEFDLIEKTHRVKMLNIEDAERAQTQSDQKTQEAIAKRNKETAKKVAEEKATAEKAARHSLEDLDTEIEAKQLENAGKNAEAKAVRIAAAFERQIEGAGTEGQKARLKRLRDLELAGLKESKDPKTQGLGQEISIRRSGISAGGGNAALDKPVKVEGQTDMLSKLDRMIILLSGGYNARAA